MDESRLRTIEQIEQFLSASALVAFSPPAGDLERYEHITRVLKRFDYPQRNKRERGVLLRYLRHTSGYSRAQITRLVAQWRKHRLAAVPLAKRYCAPSAPTAPPLPASTRPLMSACWCRWTKPIRTSAARLLRTCSNAPARSMAMRAMNAWQSCQSRTCTTCARVLAISASAPVILASFTKTRPVCNAIGVRKAPRAAGRAGFSRVDSVHQGDLDGLKGVYHITCVDEVSQWQVEACVQGISEAFLLPVLELVLAQFPFVIVGFHSDNGSKVHQPAGCADAQQAQHRADQITRTPQQ